MVHVLQYFVTDRVPAITQVQALTVSLITVRNLRYQILIDVVARPDTPAPATTAYRRIEFVHSLL
jgi:hypothetical protein